MALSNYTSNHFQASQTTPQVATEIIDILNYIDGVGDRFYVDSVSGSNSNDGGSPLRPFATIDFAVAKMTANVGDVCYIMPGHTETIIADSGVDIDIAGLAFIGLGSGSARPTLNFTTATTADFKIAAANTVVKNILFTSGITALAMMIEVSGDDALIQDCEFREGAESMDTAITVGVADADADRCVIRGCTFRMDQPGITNTGNAAIEIVKDNDNIVIEDNHIYGDFDDAGISVVAGGNASDFLTIRRNYVENTLTGTHAIEITTGGTMVGGSITDNNLVGDTSASLLEPHTLQCLGNRGHLGIANTADFPVPAPLVATGNAQLLRNSVTGMGTGHGTSDDPAIFTVTGDVMCRCWGVVQTAITSTSSNGTLSLGTADTNALFVPSITMDGTNGSQFDILANATTTVNGDLLENGSEWSVIANGVDITEFIGTNNMSAGAVDWYCEWIALSSTGDVKGA